MHPEAWLTPSIPAIAGLVFIWQATVVLDAGKAFGELQDAAFPGMVALAMGRTSRYFAVDAAVFWVLVGLVLVVTVAAGVS
ncbi:MAG: hypothetical protein AB1Z98_38640 [Nannocystaceae bacterium]